ncbi:Sulfate/thiosulfate import ATP-binding protein CysA [Streptomyces sp. ADI96-02]|uniref:ABC transporter ATP-binding protein n=1 Tax=Streptomyces sp. ADI96-02 TaxID=1522760 RepID=UPI000F55274D|nr:ATP-binding cassette domain-containing protein [Streptomyces sp. ADI96-02]RPK69263.1 Sulfate/thiosulfate import ATP-binding protein CysA [Streptomyces sp. ADI96-02]
MTPGHEGPPLTPAPEPSAAPALELTGLTRRFGSLTAVDGVGLRLPSGARHAVIGPNGAGKTTLLNLIAGTDRPDRGTIALDGRDVTRTPVARRSRLGIARSFQHPVVTGELTVLDNVVLAGWQHHPQRRGAWRSPSRYRRHTESALRRLEAVGLAALAHRPASTLSHGQRRMLDLAAALAAEPRLLLLDEPAAGLTDDGIGRLLVLLSGLPENVTMVLVEHHVEVVAELADTVTVLRAGQVLVTGPTREALAHPEVRDAYRTAGGGDDGTSDDAARDECDPRRPEPADTAADTAAPCADPRG